MISRVHPGDGRRQVTIRTHNSLQRTYRACCGDVEGSWSTSKLHTGRPEQIANTKPHKYETDVRPCSCSSTDSRKSNVSCCTLISIHYLHSSRSHIQPNSFEFLETFSRHRCLGLPSAAFPSPSKAPNGIFSQAVWRINWSFTSMVKQTRNS